MTTSEGKPKGDLKEPKNQAPSSATDHPESPKNSANQSPRSRGGGILAAMLATIRPPDREPSPESNVGGLAKEIEGPAEIGKPQSAEYLPASVVERIRLDPTTALRNLLSSIDTLSRTARSVLSVYDIGTVRQVGNGVASVWGLPQARVDELLRFPHNVMGLVMNLDRDHIDCILLGPDEGIQGGDIVWSTGRRISVPVGERLIGRVVNPLGVPLDGKGPLRANEYRYVDQEAPGVMEREAVSEPLHTGIKAIDALIPIGRGQRELIIGDRQTGKTSIAIDAIINQEPDDIIPGCSDPRGEKRPGPYNRRHRGCR